ncbi:hypothetical protein [Streptomyces sp. A1136]|nr:hypothetical protein [Streptomyces sp. A1136]
MFDSIRIVPADHIVHALPSVPRRYRATGEYPGACAAALFPKYRRK